MPDRLSRLIVLPAFALIVMGVFGARSVRSQDLTSSTPNPSGAAATPGTTPTDGLMEPGEPSSEPMEYTAAEEQLVQAFEASRTAFADALLEWRATQLRYRNEIDRSPAAVDRFREQRELVRQRMNEAFDAALEVIRVIPDSDAGSYLLTLVQMRTATDIYDEATYEAASRLLAGGAHYGFVFLSAARSGLVSGDFEAAREIYSLLKEEHLEDCDFLLKGELDLIEQRYEEEMRVREEEADQELPRVVLRTTQGDIVVELFLNQAPSTVAHFISLVEEAFYDDLDFYLVKDRLFALTGDPSGNGTGHAGRFVKDEHQRPDARPAMRGSLVLAKNRRPDGEYVPNSGSSQFGICFLPLPGLLEGGTSFGRVIEGMENVAQLRRVDPFAKKEEGEIVLPPDRILSAEVIRKPQTLPEPDYTQPSWDDGAGR